jgi:phage host-nuclease inhibitor protein Gam
MDDMRDIDLYEGEIDKKTWAVTDIDSADFAVGKVLAAQSRMSERKAVADKLHAEIDRRLQEANEDDHATIEFMTGCLRPWVQAEIQALKGRTVKLVAGKAGLRRTPDRVEIDDEDALIEWAEDNAPELVRVKKRIDKKKLKETMKERDVPHVMEIPGMDKLTISGG